MKNDLTTGQAAAVGVLAVVGVLAIIPAEMALTAWVMVKLWAWHIVPRFHLEPLTMWSAIGISCVTSIYCKPYVPSADGKTKDFLMHITLRPLLLLLTGWIAA